MFVEWGEDQIVVTIPEHLLAKGPLELGLHFGIALEGRELIATVITDQLQDIATANPKWVYSRGLETIYSYLPAGDASSITNMRTLHIPDSAQSLKIGISKWRPKQKFTLQEAVAGIYTRKNREGINIYEEMGRANVR